VLGGIDFVSYNDGEKIPSWNTVTGWFVKAPEDKFGSSKMLGPEDEQATISIEHVLCCYRTCKITYRKIHDATSRLGSNDQTALLAIPPPKLSSLRISETNANSQLSFSSGNRSVRDNFHREITRLPDTSANTTITLVPRLQEEDVERLVWTKGPKALYELSRAADISPPVVIERQRASIRKAAGIFVRGGAGMRISSREEEISASEEDIAYEKSRGKRQKLNTDNNTTSDEDMDRDMDDPILSIPACSRLNLVDK
jgi:hypothetical protein